MEQLKKAGYAVIGIGDLAVEKTRDVIGKAWSTKPKDLTKTLDSLSKRGESAVSGIYGSKPVNRATTGTKNAARQIKGAATSLKKPTGADEQKAS